MSGHVAADLTSPAGESWPPPRPKGLFYYALWHWRGWLPLDVSFWLNYAVLSAFLMLVGFIMILLLARAADPAWLGFAVAVGLVLYLGRVLIGVWQIIGIVLAAENHIKHHGGQFWARAAQAVMVLTVISLVREVNNNWPLIVKYMRLLFGVD